MRKTVFALLIFTMLFSLMACGATMDTTTEKDNQNPYLVLVNKYHRLPKDWDSKIKLVTTTNSLGENITIEKETFEHFMALREDLLKDGINIQLDSVYRSIDDQIDVWEWFRENYDEEYCQKYLAVPGFSEHHTGLAVDVYLIKDGEIINDNDEMTAEVEIFAKIHHFLPEYGFILRYPPTKEEITGYGYEPWHFRYVGQEVAKEISLDCITLEEYLGEK